MLLPKKRKTNIKISKHLLIITILAVLAMMMIFVFLLTREAIHFPRRTAGTPVIDTCKDLSTPNEDTPLPLTDIKAQQVSDCITQFLHGDNEEEMRLRFTFEPTNAAIQKPVEITVKLPLVYKDPATPKISGKLLGVAQDVVTLEYEDDLGFQTNPYPWSVEKEPDCELGDGDKEWLCGDDREINAVVQGKDDKIPSITAGSSSEELEVDDALSGSDDPLRRWKLVRLDRLA